MILELVETLREEALADLQTVSAGKPLCRISANGIQGQEAKYFEGRYAALTEIVNGAPVNSCLQAWQGQLERARHSNSSVAWMQYFGGGADALMELISGTDGEPD